MVPWYEVEDYMHLEGVGDSELSSRISDGEKYGSGNGETGADSGFSYVSGSAGQGKTGTVTIRQIRVIVHPGMPA